MIIGSVALNLGLKALLMLAAFVAVVGAIQSLGEAIIAAPFKGIRRLIWGRPPPPPEPSHEDTLAGRRFARLALAAFAAGLAVAAIQYYLQGAS